MYFNNNIKISEISNTILYSNGLLTSSLIPHWQFTPMRRNNEMENVFVQQRPLGTYTRNSMVHTTTGDAVVESDTVVPVNSEICVAKFTCNYEGYGELYIGLGEAVVQGIPSTILSGFFVVYRGGTFYFEFYHSGVLQFSFPINDWNGDNDAIDYVLKNSNELLSFQIEWNRLSRQAFLFAIIDGVSHLLHATKKIQNSFPPSYLANIPYSFTAYFNYGELTLAYASLLVSPYTYLRETTINFTVMPSPTSGAAGAVIPIVVIGARATDRQCVDILSWSVRQSTARNATSGIVEYKQHLPGIYSLMSFGGYGTNLNVVALQSAPPVIPFAAIDRYRSGAHLPNNNIDTHTSERVIKNVCRTSAAQQAETVSGLRTYCALCYNHSPLGGQVFGHITIAEY